MATQKLYLRLTDACNLSCKMCGQARRRSVDPAPAVFLDEERVRAFLGQLRPRVSAAYLWGGEPLLHPRCGRFIEVLKAHGALVEINTNGALLEQKAEELVAAQLDRVIVSIDGSAAVHDQIRGAAGSFACIERGIAALRRARTPARAGRPAIGANITVSDDNATRLVETAEACRALGLVSVSIQLPIWMTPQVVASYDDLLQAHDAKKSPFCCGYADVGVHDSLDELRRQLLALRSLDGLNVDFPPWYTDEAMLARYCSPHISVPWRGGRCVEAKRHLNVEPDGSIVLCSDLPDLALGTLERPPSEALGTELRRRLLELRPTPCHRCCSFVPSEQRDGL